MNTPFNKQSYKEIRTIAQCDGRLRALKFIRTFHVENFDVAKACLNDILNEERWTMPHIKADINAVRERISLRAI